MELLEILADLILAFGADEDGLSHFSDSAVEDGLGH